MTDETRQDGSGGEAEKTLRHELTRALTTTVVERRDLSPTEMEEVGNLARLLPEAIEHSRYHGDALAETLSRPVEEALAKLLDKGDYAGAQREFVLAIQLDKKYSPACII